MHVVVVAGGEVEGGLVEFVAGGALYAGYLLRGELYVLAAEQMA